MAEAASSDHARDYAGIAEQYAVEAQKDRYKRKFCKWVRLAAKRHLADLKKARRKKYPYYFDEWHANDICDFVEKFEHIEGEWESPYIELEPAQVFILATVFGWRRKSDGKRRFTNVYIEMARKGAKSTLTAPVTLYCLTCEGEVGPQIIIGATTGAQAEKVFNPAKKMAEKSGDFREAFGVECWAKAVTCQSSGGFIQTINAKSSTQDGWNPYVTVLDELHAHKDRGLYDVMRSAQGARKAPLHWIITTAGYNIEGVCYEQHKLVKQILEELVVADHYFGIIFTLDEGDDPYDETKWIKANPLIGVTPSYEAMRAYAIEAQSSPDSEGEFKTKRLNMWLSSKGAYLSLNQWRRGTGPVDLKALAGVPAFGGLDLASVEDIAAFVLVWFVEGRLKVHCRFYLPEETIKPRTERAKLPYESWVQQGFIIPTPGNVCDYDYIERDIDEAMATYNIQEIGFDRWNSTQLITNLVEKEAPMVEMAQGAKTFNPAMMGLKRLLKGRLVDHGGNPVLEWMASNMVARRDVNDNVAPDRKNSGEKIDGMVAMLMALARAIAHGAEQRSTYETEDLLVL